MGSEIRVFQHLLTDLKRRRDLTGRYESTSKMRSSKRTEGTDGDGVIVISEMVGGDSPRPYGLLMGTAAMVLRNQW